MQATHVVFLAFILLVSVGGGLALLLGGSALRRSSATGGRVPVDAVVVDYSNFTRPSKVTFDYPVPGGWRRATRVEGLSSVRTSGLLVQQGDRLTVWVHPQRPDDVVLEQVASPRALGGVVMMVAGVAAIVLGLAVSAGVVVLFLRA